MSPSSDTGGAGPQRAPSVLIGCGHALMSDDAIGLRVVERAAVRLADHRDIDCHDIGPASLRAVHLLADRRKAVLVDCARMGQPAGTCRRFTPAEVRSKKPLLRLSAHEGDLLAVLELARQLDQLPPQVVIFGIEPQTLKPGYGLSAALEAKLERYVAEVLDELWR